MSHLWSTVQKIKLLTTPAWKRPINWSGFRWPVESSARVSSYQWVQRWKRAKILILQRNYFETNRNAWQWNFISKILQLQFVLPSLQVELAAWSRVCMSTSYATTPNSSFRRSPNQHYRISHSRYVVFSFLGPHSVFLGPRSDTRPQNQNNFLSTPAISAALQRPSHKRHPGSCRGTRISWRPPSQSWPGQLHHHVAR